MQLKILNGLQIFQTPLSVVAANFSKSTLFVHRNIYIRLIIRIVAVRKINLPDFAISEIKKPFEIFPLNNQVGYDIDNIIIEDGTPKLFLSSESIAEINSNSTYLVAGTVGNKLVNSVRLERVNVLHDGLKLDSFDKEGIAYLKSEEEPNLDNWSGLSGAPLFNDKGELSGMLIRGPEESPYASAIPITRILHYINLIIETEK